MLAAAVRRLAVRRAARLRLARRAALRALDASRRCELLDVDLPRGIRAAQPVVVGGRVCLSEGACRGTIERGESEGGKPERGESERGKPEGGKPEGGKSEGGKRRDAARCGSVERVACHFGAQ